MIAIITVLYNSAEVLRDFFHSLERQTCRRFTLYIVDNASPDDSLALARILSETVTFETIFIRNASNGGIAQGNNLGIRAALRAGHPWILLSNNDTVWPPGALAALYEKTVKHRIQIAVPKILIHNTTRIWYAGGGWNRWRGGTRHHRYGSPDTKKGESSRPVAYAPTCCMLIRSDVFTRTGLMDEHFFVYYDDSDFIRRATRAGFKVWYMPEAIVEHKESISIGNLSPFAQYWLSRNLILFTRKHFSRGYLLYVLAVNLLILFAKRAFTFGRKQWRASAQGYLDAIRPKRKLRTGMKMGTACTD